jgi:hypothetical protein
MGSSALIPVPSPALFDSNILIDSLLSRGEGTAVLLACPVRAISTITAIEVLAGAADQEWGAVRALLDDFDELPLDPDVRDEAARIRRDTRLKLPDAIIWATARVHRLPLVTRNSRDFPTGNPQVLIPYTLP